MVRHSSTSCIIIGSNQSKEIGVPPARHNKPANIVVIDDVNETCMTDQSPEVCPISDSSSPIIKLPIQIRITPRRHNYVLWNAAIAASASDCVRTDLKE